MVKTVELREAYSLISDVSMRLRLGDIFIYYLEVNKHFDLTEYINHININ
jgi:hypothetical protein